MSAPVSRRRVHEARRRQARNDLLAAFACWLLMIGIGSWLLMLWLVSGGWLS